MSDERRRLQVLIEILSAYIAVTDDPDKLMRVCANVSGSDDDETAAVAAAFGIGEIAAQAVLDLQIRRFTPKARERIRDELDDLRRRLGRRTS